LSEELELHEPNSRAEPEIDRDRLSLSADWQTALGTCPSMNT
jgi:hypothetical protein